MKNILVATDFSQSGTNACDYAVRLASQTGAEVTVLNVVTMQVIDPVAPAFYLDPLIVDKQQESKSLLASLEERYKDILYPDKSPLSFQIKSVVGVPGVEIRRNLEESNAELLIIGSRHSNFWTRLGGSTVTDLAGELSVPMLVVPEEASFKGIRSVVVATDLKNDADDFIRNVVDFARTFDAWVHILYVDESPTEQKEEQFAVLESQKHQLAYDKVIFELVRLKNPSKIVDLFLEKENANLLVLRKQKRNFISELFHTSFTKEKIYNSETPLLIY